MHLHLHLHLHLQVMLPCCAAALCEGCGRGALPGRCPVCREEGGAEDTLIPYRLLRAKVLPHPLHCSISGS